MFKHVEDGSYVHFWNEDADALVEFVEAHEEAMFCSYNGSHYDQWILKAIAAGCDTEQVKEINDVLIGGDPDTPIWEHPYLADTWFRINDVDLMKDTQIGTSLKSIEGHLGMSVEESEVGFDVTHRLTDEERADVLRYCTHDVDATEDLLLVRRDYLDTKLTLGERAGLSPARRGTRWPFASRRRRRSWTHRPMTTSSYGTTWRPSDMHSRRRFPIAWRCTALRT